MIFSNIRTDFNFIFGQFSVARSYQADRPLVYILAHIWKTVFQIVSPCTYVSTVVRSAFADIPVTLVPLDFYVTAQHDPEKRKKIFYFFHIFYFNSKGSYQIASILDMYIIIKERVDVNHFFKYWKK